MHDDIMPVHLRLFYATSLPFLLFPPAERLQEKWAELKVGRVFGAQLSDAVMAISGDWQRGGEEKEGERMEAISRSDIPLDRRRRRSCRSRRRRRKAGEEMRGIAGKREAEEKGGNVSISSRTFSNVMGTCTTFPQGEI